MPTVDVDGLETYYEIHGEGDPLVLLHGGVTGLAGLEPLVLGLAGGRRVIAVELQAHGRTADIDRPLSWTAMAADVAGLLDRLGIPSADWMGYSLGGGAALHAAVQHPDRLRRLVLLSAPFARHGWYPDVLEAMGQMGSSAAEGMKRSPLAQLYPGVDWDVLFTKLRDLLAQDYDLSSEVAALKIPVMLA
jgi:pimeloyl-ACP methyl ester carboxylesterase